MRRMLSSVAAALVMAPMLALTAGPTFGGGGDRTVVHWRSDGRPVTTLHPSARLLLGPL